MVIVVNKAPLGTYMVIVVIKALLGTYRPNSYCCK